VTNAPEPPDGEHAHCRYREPDGSVCGRLLTDPASVALQIGRTHFRRMVGAVGRRRRIAAVHQGQLVLDLDGDVENAPRPEPATNGA
jgi:hypothetical protein